MEKNILEITGTITKEEILTSLDHDIIQNTCTLEDKTPFSGYYGDRPLKHDPCCVFIMLAEMYSFEEVLRAVKNIKVYFDQPFDATYSEILVYNNKCAAIRLRHIKNHKVIPELQKCFINEGFKLRNKKMNVNSKGIIKVTKTFKVENLGNGTFLDKNDPEFGYFIIPQNLSWKLFEKVTISFKNNWKNERFDSAIGTFFMSSGLEDVIRVYSEQMDKRLLDELKEKYTFHINKILSF